MANSKSFSVTKALSFGFGVVFENFMFFLGVMASYVGIMIVAGGIIGSLAFAPAIRLFYGYFQNVQSVQDLSLQTMSQEMMKKMGAEIGYGLIILVILMAVIGTFLKLGLIKIALAFYDRKVKEQHISTLFSQGRVLFSGFIAKIIFGVLIMLGFLLFVIPGFYVLAAYNFFEFFIVDRHVGILDSFKKSGNLTSGQRMHILGFLIVLGIIAMVPSIIFAPIGLITWPASVLAQTYVYRKLQETENVAAAFTQAPMS